MKTNTKNPTNYHNKSVKLKRNSREYNEYYKLYMREWRKKNKAGLTKPRAKPKPKIKRKGHQALLKGMWVNIFARKSNGEPYMEGRAMICARVRIGKRYVPDYYWVMFSHCPLNMFRRYVFKGLPQRDPQEYLKRSYLTAQEALFNLTGTTTFKEVECPRLLA